MNYEITARSNYFRVKDPQAFIDAVKALNTCMYAERHDSQPEKVALFVAVGGWPGYRVDEEADEHDFDLVEFIAAHLKDDDIAVLMAIGHEGLRYVTGYAQAINANGDTVEVTLEDIYQRAFDMFGMFPSTRCEL